MKVQRFLAIEGVSTVTFSGVDSCGASGAGSAGGTGGTPPTLPTSADSYRMSLVDNVLSAHLAQ